MRRSVVLIALSFLTLAGCAQEPQGTAESSNVLVPAVKLTEIDGCVVYRFRDAGNYRYFAKCPMPAMVSVSSHEGCGKNCTKPYEIQTVQN